MIQRPPDDSEKHQHLIMELLQVFRQKGFTVTEAEGQEGFQPPRELHNDGYGDQEDKAPDIYAYDPSQRTYVLGEAKTGLNDLETEHALTQYNVFLDQAERRTGKRFKLYLILPSTKVPEFNTLITHYIHRDYWQNIVLVSSAHIAE